MHRIGIGQPLIIVALCLSLPAGALGQSPQPPTAGDAAGSHFRVMKYLDGDRDRRIDADEFAAGLETASMLLMLSWNDCDRDGDGAIDAEELGAAVAQARQALAEVEPEDEEEAAEALASALPVRVLLDQLAGDDRYADEIADLREAVEDLGDDDAVVSYITRYPTRYPHLSPVVRTWGRYYPVKSGLRSHHWRRTHVPPKHLKHTKPVKPASKVGPKPKAKARSKAGAKPKAAPKPKARRKP